MSLCFSFNSTMSSGSRKFCDFLRLLKFLFQSISNMFAYGFNIPSKKLGKLISIQPYGICIYLHQRGLGPVVQIAPPGSGTFGSEWS